VRRKAESIVTSLDAKLSWYGQIVGFAPPGVPPVPVNGAEASTTVRSG
jgi:hypothetical protein